MPGVLPMSCLVSFLACSLVSHLVSASHPVCSLWCPVSFRTWRVASFRTWYRASFRSVSSIVSSVVSGIVSSVVSGIVSSVVSCWYPVW
jgi:hypothetical protein